MVDFNRSRGAPIVLLTKYAKSRPDFTMRLATIQYYNAQDETEDETEETLHNNTVSSLLKANKTSK